MIRLLSRIFAYLRGHRDQVVPFLQDLAALVPPNATPPEPDANTQPNLQGTQEKVVPS